MVARAFIVCTFALGAYASSALPESASWWGVPSFIQSGLDDASSFVGSVVGGRQLKQTDLREGFIKGSTKLIKSAVRNWKHKAFMRRGRKLIELGGVDGDCFDGIDQLLDPIDVQGLVAMIRGCFCTAEVKAEMKSGSASMDVAISDFMDGMPSVNSLIDSGWDCLCYSWQIGSEYSDVVAAVADLVAGVSDADETFVDTQLETLVNNMAGTLKELIPVIMGPTGACGGACQTFGTQLGDYIINYVDMDQLDINQVVGEFESEEDSTRRLEEESEDFPGLGWMPPLTALAGLPSAAANCMCNGVNWPAFAALITDDIAKLSKGATKLLTSGDEDEGDGEVWQIETDMPDAIDSLARYPAFLMSQDAMCSADCNAGGLIEARYAISAISSVLTDQSWVNYILDIDADDVDLSSIGSAVALIDAENLQLCICGGTLDWGQMMSGAAHVFGMLGGVRGYLYGIENAIYMGLQNLFSPFFFCSTGSCKTVTEQIMHIVGTAGTTIPVENLNETLVEIGTYQWCPADPAAAAFGIKQTYTIASDVSSFGSAEQEEFKGELVTNINEGVSGKHLLTNSQVQLDVSGGSTAVEATITVAAPGLAGEVEAKMASMAQESTSDLSAELGVQLVEQPSAPQQSIVSAQLSQLPPDDSGGGGGGSSAIGTAVIAGAAAGGAVALVVLVGVVVFYKKKKNGDGGKKVAPVGAPDGGNTSGGTSTKQAWSEKTAADGLEA